MRKTSERLSIKKLLLSLVFATFCFGDVYSKLHGLYVTDKQFFDAVKSDKKILLITSKKANIRDEYGRTPIMYASKIGNLSLVEKLIEKGADVSAVDNNDNTALTLAIESHDMAEGGSKYLSHHDRRCYYGAEDAFSLIDRQHDLKKIITKLEEELVKVIEQASDINARDKDGRTALMLAAAGGNIFLVKKLIEKGADINIKDNNGNNAIMYAAKKNADTASEVENHDTSELYPSMYYGRFWGILSRLAAVLNILKEKGADTNVEDNNGKTCSYYIELAQNCIHKYQEKRSLFKKYKYESTNQTKKTKAKKTKKRKSKKK